MHSFCLLFPSELFANLIFKFFVLFNNTWAASAFKTSHLSFCVSLHLTLKNDGKMWGVYLFFFFLFVYFFLVFFLEGGWLFNGSVGNNSIN